jgi:serine/threonine protein kinase
LFLLLLCTTVYTTISISALSSPQYFSTIEYEETMGVCLSSPIEVLDMTDGDEAVYRARFREEDKLGKGEFGVVCKVYDKQEKDEDTPLACIILRKRVVFKGNRLYSTLAPEVFRGEVEMLRTLRGDQFCLKLTAIYETPRSLYMVTELCEGGEMMDYAASQKEDLRTEDVSRIAFQLLSAVDHCAKHNIIHRDIKPENVMFRDLDPKSELRLIDFGSGTMDSPEMDGRHTTFVGTPFYVSPEMLQNKYTQLTDVFSVGVVLYVLVAGYPACMPQKTFNILQKGTKRNMRDLPNVPDNTPDSFYDLLDGCLTYRPAQRPSAELLLDYEFVQFHKDVKISKKHPSRPSVHKTASVFLLGSTARHNVYLEFSKFERSVTTLLAALLRKKEFEQLVQILKGRIQTDATIEECSEEDDTQRMSEEDALESLAVISVRELKKILKEIIRNESM